MATLILRPNGVGSETNIDTQFPATGQHWDKVDEANPDEETTYLENKLAAAGVWQRDLYSLKNPPPNPEADQINFITVYLVTKHNVSGARAVIRTHGNTYEKVVPSGSAWMKWWEQWINNPFTLAPWTWQEIKDMEIGVSLSGSTAAPDWARCTQVYVEIDYGVEAAGSLDLQVVAANCDCAVWRTAVPSWVLNLGVGYQWVGYASASNNHDGGGMVFNNVAIPQGTTIARAYLILTSNASDATGMIKSVIIGEAVDNAAVFSDIANYQGRRGTIVGGPNDNNITLASVNWDYIHIWVVGVEYISPDISAIIQEIINRPGWVSGNSLALYWDDHAGRSDAGININRRGYSREGSAALAPKLHIEYSALPTVQTDPATEII